MPEKNESRIDLRNFNARKNKFGQPVLALAFGKETRNSYNRKDAISDVEDVFREYHNRKIKSHYRRFPKLMLAGKEAILLGWKEIGFIEGITAPFITEEIIVRGIESIIASESAQKHCKKVGIKMKFKTKPIMPQLPSLQFDSNIDRGVDSECDDTVVQVFPTVEQVKKALEQNKKDREELESYLSMGERIQAKMASSL